MGENQLLDSDSLPKLGWVTLVTRTTYLPGALLLAYSLKKHQSKYPLVILTTPGFQKSYLSVLQQECKLTNSRHMQIPPLVPPVHNLPETLIAPRFEDTWTKLRVFELYKYGCEKLVFLDADMLVRRNMDELFDMQLPGNDWIAANHACVCNLDHDSWAPDDWNKENCAYTGLGPESLPTPVAGVGEKDGKRTYTLLNSGLFIFSPFQRQWEEMIKFLNEDEKVKSYLFPDQDFLADFFRGRWKSMSWKYNALKTMRYWHQNLWVDDEVRNLHYIVDKPWRRRMGSDGIAGYLGKDGVTHQWWWDEFKQWKGERESEGMSEVLELMRTIVVQPLEDGQD
ncbi:glycosyltransferase family 8 protein [Stipitochalara longipes BDJ]|nr:glycosyltransferase family 8 protein [Stipitochalara longipes BDJ]